MAEERVQRRLAAIVSADVVGYSKMMGQDETGTLARLKSLRSEFLHPKITEYGGRIVKTTGDGTLIEFASAVDAVSHAIDVQQGIAERNSGLSDDQQILLRLGINVGDIIIDGEDIFGDGVNVAARLEALAEPGGICVSARVFDYVGNRLDIAFDDLGKQSMKNIAVPVHVYRFRLAANNGADAPEQPDTPPALPDKPSIAVLPFDSYSTDAEQDAFADGMTEDLTTDLSKVTGLFVVARNSAQVFKGQLSNLPQVAQSLGVRYLLEGSVRKSGERVRINAQLIDAITGGHLWADRFDGTIHDVFELQDEVSAKVVEALSVKLTQSEKRSLGTVHADNLEAYELFVRAKAAPYPPIPERIGAAREMFETVIEMAPDFSGGYAGAAAMIGFSALWSHDDVWRDASRAEELAGHAIAADNTFAWSYTALGLALLLQKKRPAWSGPSLRYRPRAGPSAAKKIWRSNIGGSRNNTAPAKRRGWARLSWAYYGNRRRSGRRGAFCRRGHSPESQVLCRPLLEHAGPDPGPGLKLSGGDRGVGNEFTPAGAVGTAGLLLARGRLRWARRFGEGS